VLGVKTLPLPHMSSMKITFATWFIWLIPAWWGHSGPECPHAGPEYLGNHAGPDTASASS